MPGVLNVFITGQPGIGKTSVLRRVMNVLQREGFRAGGIYCPEIREQGRRKGFQVIDLLTGERGILSHIQQPSGPRVGRYRVNLRDLSRVGVLGINRAIEGADYIVIDEVGPMELKLRGFQRAVLRALESSKPVLGVLHWRMRDQVIDALMDRVDVDIYEVTRENRDTLHLLLARRLGEGLKGLDSGSGDRGWNE